MPGMAQRLSAGLSGLCKWWSEHPFLCSLDSWRFPGFSMAVFAELTRSMTQHSRLSGCDPDHAGKPRQAPGFRVLKKRSQRIRKRGERSVAERVTVDGI